MYELGGLAFASPQDHSIIQPGEWREIGFDVDGLVTHEGDAPSCTTVAGDTTDGTCGIDNAFGAAFLDQQEFGIDVRFTYGQIARLLLRVKGLGAAPDQGPLKATFYVALPDLDEKLEVESDWANGDPEVPTLGWLDAYLVDDTLVVESNASIPVPLTFDTLHWAELTVHRAMFSMTLSADRQTGHGVLGGYLDARELGDTMTVGVRGYYPGDSCITTATPDRWQTLSDMRADGAVGGDCDSVSIGALFGGRATAIAGVAPPRNYPICNGASP